MASLVTLVALMALLAVTLSMGLVDRSLVALTAFVVTVARLVQLELPERTAWMATWVARAVLMTMASLAWLVSMRLVDLEVRAAWPWSPQLGSR